ncbi:MAG: hypothetical protein ABIY70_00140 [Capsulimonas sp.]|uniref:hypothetical protein n=1 Tax=Capsulimonas sp. TaxID=2494211 RepID=UPI003264DD46
MDDQSSAPIEIGWPPIDLNDAAPPSMDKMNRPESLAVAFVGGVVLASVGIGGYWMGALGILGFPALVAAILVYGKERKDYPRWANFLGAGVLLGLIAIFVSVFYHLSPITARR